MKVYVISDNTDYGIVVANQINRSGHVAMLSETMSEDQRTLLSDVRANINSNFDLIILLCTRAQDATISANKIGGAQAVHCKDREDAEEATSDSGANVIVIDSTKVTKTTLSSIVNGLLAGQEKPTESHSRAKEREVAEAPRQVSNPGAGFGSFFSGLKDSASNVASKASSVAQPKAQAPKPKAASRPEPRGPSMMSNVKSKGLAQSLKEALGIIDDK